MQRSNLIICRLIDLMTMVGLREPCLTLSVGVHVDVATTVNLSDPFA